MLRQDLRSSARHYQAPDRDLDALALRMRRLALHQGYVRREVVSPLLKRLMPSRRPAGGPAAEMAGLRRRVRDAGLHSDAVAYLIEMIEDELDSARIRLT